MHRSIMKKLMIALLILGIFLSVSACGKKSEAAQTESVTIPETDAAVQTTEAPTEPTETEPTEQHYTLTFAGDCTLGYMPGHEYSYAGFKAIVGDDFEYPFRNVREYFENDDFTMVNFEGTLGYEGTAAVKTFNFRGRPEYTQILTSSSVEAVTLANNHSLDYGQAGYVETKRLLDEAGVPYVEKDSSRLVVTESGLKIGLYAAAFVIDQKDLEAEVAALREQGAEIVVFAIHWGVEGSYHSFSDQWKQAYRAIDAGVDIVYGHHPHVLQKVEQYNGGYIFYSLGNFSFGGNQAPLDMDTAMMQLDVIRDLDGNVTLGELTIIPCCISSISGSNNYQPTPYREGTAGYQRVMEKLQGIWKGVVGLDIYSQADDITAPSTPPVKPEEPEETTEPAETVAPTVPTEPGTEPTTQPTTQPTEGESQPTEGESQPTESVTPDPGENGGDGGDDKNGGEGENSGETPEPENPPVEPAPDMNPEA